MKRLSDEIDQLKQSFARQVKPKAGESVNDSNATIASRFAVNQISDADVLSLNIGGTKIDVSRATLTSIPSLLASKFSGEWDSSLPKDAEGRFFIDEEPELFVALVNYLRDYSRMIPLENKDSVVAPKFTDEAKQNRFYRMLDAYHLTDHFFPFELWKFDQENWGIPYAARRFVTQIHQGQANNYYYFLQRVGQSRRQINSFEVQLNADVGATVRIGWLHYDIAEADDNALVNSMVGGVSLTLNVLGKRIETVEDKDEEATWSHTVLSFANDKNPIIRCADQGAEWFVDGKLVAEIAGQNTGCDTSKLNPFIDFKGTGSFRFTKVEYELCDTLGPSD